MAKVWAWPWEAFMAGDFEYLLKWMNHNWTLSIYISFAYVLFIFGGQVLIQVTFLRSVFEFSVT